MLEIVMLAFAYRSCPFNGHPCTLKCAIYVESETGEGYCGLIANIKDNVSDEKEGSVNNDERSL